MQKHQAAPTPRDLAFEAGRGWSVLDSNWKPASTRWESSVLWSSVPSRSAALLIHTADKVCRENFALAVFA